MAATIDRSLRRLRVDVIDLMQIHGLLAEHYEDAVAEHLPVLRQAQTAGKIRFIGVSERYFDDSTHATLRRAVSDDHFDTVMVGYNLLHQTAERDIFPAAHAADIGLIVMVAVRRALSDPSRLREVVADLVARKIIGPDVVPLDDPLGWLVRGDTPSVTAAAYRYARSCDEVATVLTGTSRMAHLDANVKSVAQGPLPELDLERLRGLFGHVEEALGN